MPRRPDIARRSELANAAFEVLRMTEPVKQAIHQKESASTIRRLALSEGMTSLRQDAVRKVFEITGLDTSLLAD